MPFSSSRPAWADSLFSSASLSRSRSSLLNSRVRLISVAAFCRLNPSPRSRSSERRAMSRGCGNAKIVVSPAVPPVSSTCAASVRRFINSMPTSRLSCWQHTALTLWQETVNLMSSRVAGQGYGGAGTAWHRLNRICPLLGPPIYDPWLLGEYVEIRRRHRLTKEARQEHRGN